MTDVVASLTLFQEAMKRKPQLSTGNEKLVADFIVTYVLTRVLDKTVEDDINVLIISFRTRYLSELDPGKIKNCIKKIQKKIKLEDQEKITLRELAIICDMASLLVTFNRLHRLNILKDNDALNDVYEKLKHCYKLTRLLGLTFYTSRRNLATENKIGSLREYFNHLKELDVFIGEFQEK